MEEQVKPKKRHVVVTIGESIGEVLGDIGKRIENVVEAVGYGRRDNVVMVRVSNETLARLDDLVEAELFKSRSESAAFLIQAGIQAQQALFSQISEKVEQIRKLREELRKMAGRE